MKIHRFIFYFLAITAGWVFGMYGQTAYGEENPTRPIQLHSGMGHGHEGIIHLKADMPCARMAQAQDEGSGTESKEGTESDKSGETKPASDKSDPKGSETDKKLEKEKGDKKEEGKGKADKSASSKKSKWWEEGSGLYEVEGK